MGELDYFSAGVGLYAFLLSINVESVDFFFFFFLKLLVHGGVYAGTRSVDSVTGWLRQLTEETSRLSDCHR